MQTSSPPFFHPSEMASAVDETSQLSFRRLYEMMLFEKVESLPLDLSLETRLLLLTAIVSETLSLSYFVDGSQANGGHNENPFLPLSPQRESKRMRESLSTGLKLCFSDEMIQSNPHYASYYYLCQLHLKFPFLLHFRDPVDQSFDDCCAIFRSFNPKLLISDDAIKECWRILEWTAQSNESSSSKWVEPWAPIAIWKAGLCLWIQLRVRKDLTYSFQTLLLYARELEKFDMWSFSSCAASKLRELALMNKMDEVPKM